MEAQALREQLTSAIEAHELWRTRLVAAVLTGRGPLTVATARREDTCEFGAWLDHLRKTLEDPHMAKVRELHHRFHEEAARVLELTHGGRRGEALGSIGAAGSFVEVSTELVAALRAWADAV
jgi:hypothetical protein